jgi:hypothetical protein
MNELLIQAFEKAQIPDYLQNKLAQQLIEDIENELKWQKTLTQQQNSKLEKLVAKALNNFIDGKTKTMGFDEL